MTEDQKEGGFGSYIKKKFFLLQDWLKPLPEDPLVVQIIKTILKIITLVVLLILSPVLLVLLAFIFFAAF